MNFVLKNIVFAKYAMKQFIGDGGDTAQKGHLYKLVNFCLRFLIRNISHFAI